MNKAIHYTEFNREERFYCSHLFRLLHESLHLKGESPLGQLINQLSRKKPEINFSSLAFDNIGIYSEAAIIRDTFHALKPNIIHQMDNLVKHVMQQENVSSCRLYSELPEKLQDPKQTHPNQICQKARKRGLPFRFDEYVAYKAIQGFFNAKPDLVITIDNYLFVFEAKFTEAFDQQQLKRTKNIANTLSALFYKELGFDSIPHCIVATIGNEKFNPDLSWNDILLIANNTWNESDLGLIALKAAKKILTGEEEDCSNKVNSSQNELVNDLGYLRVLIHTVKQHAADYDYYTKCQINFPTVFSTYGSLILRMKYASGFVGVLTLIKLFDEKEACSIRRIISKIKNKNYPNQSDWNYSLEASVNVFDNLLDDNKLMKILIKAKTIRDEYYAHLDKNRNNFYEFAIGPEDFIYAISTVEQIFNKIILLTDQVDESFTPNESDLGHKIFQRLNDWETYRENYGIINS